MKTLDWLNDEITQGAVCEAYTEKAKSCQSKKQLFDLACDINGSIYLCESLSLDLKVIEREFSKYINGKCKNTLANNTDDIYTSAIYCNYTGNVYADTTITTFLGCTANVELEEYTSAFVFVDGKSDLVVYCPSTSMARIEVYNGGKVKAIGEGRIKVKYK